MLPSSVPPELAAYSCSVEVSSPSASASPYSWTSSLGGIGGSDRDDSLWKCSSSGTGGREREEDEFKLKE
jgi:hypothetical protein